MAGYYKLPIDYCYRNKRKVHNCGTAYRRVMSSVDTLKCRCSGFRITGEIGNETAYKLARLGSASVSSIRNSFEESACNILNMNCKWENPTREAVFGMRPFYKKFLGPDFFKFYLEKNADGTKNFRLQGNELRYRISRVLTAEDMISVVQFMITVPNLVRLNLAYNTIGDAGLNYLVYNYLRYPNELVELNLMHNDITEQGLQSISYIGDAFTVKSLRLTGNKFGTEGGQLFGLILAENQNIEYLDLAETDQTLSSIAFLTATIREDRGHNHSIKVLNISRVIPNFERYQYQTSHLAETVGEMLRFNTTLVELHLQKCQLKAHDVELMLIGMQHNNTLKFLDLGYNNIADMGIDLLGQHLKEKRPNMLGLNVAGNQITDHGARALSFTLPFTKIRLLDISYNRIKATGIQDLLNTIKKPYMLRFLSMWGNELNDVTNRIIDRLMRAKVLDQNFCDVKVAVVDGVYVAGRYPSDLYKHKYYCQLDYGGERLPPVKIKKNLPTGEDDQYKVCFKDYPKLPLLKMIYNK